MELKLRDGDYVPDGGGGFLRVDGDEALCQRVLYRLTARRGALPFRETLGSRLWQLGSLAASARQSAAKQYAAEALEDEDVRVTGVTLTPLAGGAFHLAVRMESGGGELTAEVDVQ
jgi:phage gp46-like protein